MLRLFWYW